MKPRARKILRGAGVALAVAAVLLGVALWRVGAIAKGAVNAIAPKVLGVPVSVESVDVSVLRGEIRVANFEVGNPEGFDTPYLFHADLLHVDVAMRDLFKGLCHIREIHLGGPRVWYHQTLSASNVSAFLDQLQRRFPPDEGPGRGAETAGGGRKRQMPVVIDRFLVDEGTVGVKLGAGFEVPLMEIELRDIGKEGAFLPVQVVQVLVKSILGSVVHAVGGIGGVAVDGAKAVGGAAVEGLGAVARGIGSLFGGGGDADAGTNAPLGGAAKP